MGNRFIYGYKAEMSLGFQTEGADSDRFSVSLSVLFSETPNSGGASATSDHPLTTALQRFYVLK
jgi:hypothetical protein